MATVNRTARRAARLGGPAGNEILTSASAVVLTLLLIAEGITILEIGSLRSEHMFVGMVLIPPVLLKLGSTGYRFARYYAGTRAYVDRGPPPLPLRLLAPLLVLATLVVFATGVALLVVGHKSGALFTLHKVSFSVWGAVFGVHFLAHLPRMARSLRSDWTAAGRSRLPGSGARTALVVASIGGGIALALAVLPLITSWHGHRSF
jgi:hypothetical protein